MILTKTDFPFRAAATLAVDLIKEHPELSDRKAALAAWQTYEKLERPGDDKQFRGAPRFHINEVIYLMRDIRSDSQSRVQYSGRVWEKALRTVEQSSAEIT